MKWTLRTRQILFFEVGKNNFLMRKNVMYELRNFFSWSQKTRQVKIQAHVGQQKKRVKDRLLNWHFIGFSFCHWHPRIFIEILEKIKRKNFFPRSHSQLTYIIEKKKTFFYNRDTNFFSSLHIYLYITMQPLILSIFYVTRKKSSNFFLFYFYFARYELAEKRMKQ